MFEIRNQFHEESLDYKDAEKILGNRYDEAVGLQNVTAYCAAIGEKIECDIDQMYETEVERNVFFCDWLYGNAGEADYDMRRMFLEIIQTFTDIGSPKDGIIDISLGEMEECICDETGYRNKRREYLAQLSNADSYYDFMKSCFLDSEFSEIIRDAMKKIPDFSSCTREITENLSLLNDQAIEIYQKHNNNAKEAMRELASKALACSGDPRHKNELKFPFSYQVNENGTVNTYVAEITCTSHMKLLRRDSDLRIYFYWFDKRIQNGEKVLIGLIGGHPY